MNKEQVKELRRSLNLTQVKFAELLHISVRTVKSWESGTRRPSGLYLEALLNVKQRIPIFEENKERASAASEEA